MIKPALLALALSMSIALTAPAAQAHTPAEQVEILGTEGFSGVIARRGNLYVGSQPDEAALAQMAEAGVTVVINLRTDGEMEGLSFNEPEVVEGLGMRYVSVPQGGSDHPPVPEALDQVSAAIAEAGGAPVLLHCASGARASHMFAAWLHRERGVPLNEAIDQGREIGFATLPIEGLLGTQFEMRIPDEPES